MTSAAPRLLVVDDEPDLRTLYELTLLREGYDVDAAGCVEEAWGMLESAPGRYPLVITDMRLPDGTGLELLRRLEAADRPEKTIIITAYGSAENAVEALKAGAYDYLTKPVDLRQFRAVVASALGRGGARLPIAPPAPPAPAQASGSPALRRLVGRSEAMQQVRNLVGRVARSMAPVLIHGESGTGKELVARAIHAESARAAGPFVAVNCGAIPEHLLEAEFFGYRKGAFTGAQADHEGFFQAAQGGTLFLDEIGELPLALQSKLLRAVQERAVRPLGAVAELPLDVRLVSATHRDLGEEVRDGRFRQDLFYRLNVIRIALPPLRERLGDLTELCATVLARIAEEAGVRPVPDLQPEALRCLMRYRFPGNVRELENLLHRAVALAEGPAITVADLALPEALLDDGSDGATAWGELGGSPAGEPVSPGPTDPDLPTDLAAHLDEVERRLITQALAAYRYNRTAAGARLGLTLRQMRYRMARLGITAPGSEGDAD